MDAAAWPPANRQVPIFDSPFSMFLDKINNSIYGENAASRRIDVADLRIPYPGGVLLGGNGLVSGDE